MIKEDRGPLDLTLQIERQYQDNLKLRREITVLEQQILETGAENIKLRKQIEFLTLTSNEAAAKLLKQKELKTQAELEMSLVKAVGQNSPEMKAALKKIKKLEQQIETLINPVQKAREGGL